jgi:hypothetical protein
MDAVLMALGQPITTPPQQQHAPLQVLRLHNPEAFLLYAHTAQRLAAAVPQLHSFTGQNFGLVDVACLKALMGMKHLRQLSVGLVSDEATEGMTVGWPVGRQPVVAWPVGRPPVSLHVGAIILSQFPALPLQHCSRVDCNLLLLRGEATRQQLVEGMRTAQAHARKCPEVQISGIGAMDGQVLPGGGLSALLMNSPLQLTSLLKLNNLDLKVEDLQGLAAAAGSSLTHLIMNGCVMTDAAQATLFSPMFPALKAYQSDEKLFWRNETNSRQLYLDVMELSRAVRADESRQHQQPFW